MTLHDWIDQLCTALDLDTQVDQTLVLDLARDVAHGVARPAAPLSTFLLGLAAGARGSDPALVAELAERTRALAAGWAQTGAPVTDQPADTAADELDGADDTLTEVEDLDAPGPGAHGDEEE